MVTTLVKICFHINAAVEVLYYIEIGNTINIDNRSFSNGENNDMTRLRDDYKNRKFEFE